jgi:hypothetical protein
MTDTPIRLQFAVHIERTRAGKQHLRSGPPPEDHPIGRLPRATRLLALAYHYTALIAQGQVRDYADLARQLDLTRARVTQVMQLLHLAPDLQEAVLALPPVFTGHDPIGEKAIRRIAREPLWARQRALWQQLLPLPEDTPDACQPSTG